MSSTGCVSKSHLSARICSLILPCRMKLGHAGHRKQSQASHRTEQEHGDLRSRRFKEAPVGLSRTFYVFKFSFLCDNIHVSVVVYVKTSIHRNDLFFS